MRWGTSKVAQILSKPIFRDDSFKSGQLSGTTSKLARLAMELFAVNGANFLLLSEGRVKHVLYLCVKVLCHRQCYNVCLSWHVAPYIIMVSRLA